MRYKRVACLFVISASVIMTPVLSQSQPGSPAPTAQVEQSEGEIARALADQGQSIAIPVKGRVKQSIKKEAVTFLLPTGESRALLFRLPDYDAPYSLIITSQCNHGCLGFTKSIFVPSGTFLDAEFRPTRQLDESEFENLRASAFKAYRIEADVLVDDLQNADRYLLVYTIGKDVGDVWFTFPLRGLMKANEVKAAAVGSLELEVRPGNKTPVTPEADRGKDDLKNQESKPALAEDNGRQGARPDAHSAQLYPLKPEMWFPVDALASFVRSPRFGNFDVWLSEGGENWLLTTARNPRLRGSGSGSYQFQAGRYNVLVVTPVLEWYLNERPSIQIKKKEAKRQEKTQVAYDAGQLHWDWSEYEDKIRSVVHVMTIPDFCQTTLSWALSGVLKGVTQLKYKTSFSEMSLLCDGKEIQPIAYRRFQVELPEGYGTPEGAVAFAGDYEYSPGAFDRNGCGNLELRIVSDGHTYITARPVPGKIKQQVWTDFEGYRRVVGGKSSQR